jgi:hypothetical protein
MNKAIEDSDRFDFLSPVSRAWAFQSDCHPALTHGATFYRRFAGYDQFETAEFETIDEKLWSHEIENFDVDAHWARCRRDEDSRRSARPPGKTANCDSGFSA